MVCLSGFRILRPSALAASPFARRYWLTMFFSLIFLIAAAPVTADRIAAPAPNGEKSSGVEEKKLDLERAKFEFEKVKYKDELDQKRRDSQNDLIKTVVAALSLGVPFLIAVIGVWAESRNRRRNDIAERDSREKNEKLQFQLKAAEIALDVRNSGEIQPKAAALAQLFPDRLPQNFAKNLDPETIRFGPPTTDAKMELLKLLAQYPNERGAILRIWSHMFPADVGKWNKSEHLDYSWFKAIIDDANLNKGQK